MNYGKIVAVDRPAKLKHAIQSTSSIEVAFKEQANKKQLKFKGVAEVKKFGDKFRLYTEKPEDIIHLLVKYSKNYRNKIITINTIGPSLEDVFVKLTKGRKK